MQHEHHTTLPGTTTTCADVGRWVGRLACLHARLAPRFARPESYRRALAWSWWRHCHQGRASYSHTKRRRKAG